MARGVLSLVRRQLEGHTAAPRIEGEGRGGSGDGDGADDGVGVSNPNPGPQITVTNLNSDVAPPHSEAAELLSISSDLRQARTLLRQLQVWLGFPDRRKVAIGLETSGISQQSRSHEYSRSCFFCVRVMNALSDDGMVGTLGVSHKSQPDPHTTHDFRLLVWYNANLEPLRPHILPEIVSGSWPAKQRWRCNHENWPRPHLLRPENKSFAGKARTFRIKCRKAKRKRK